MVKYRKPITSVVLIGCSKKKRPYIYDRTRSGRVFPKEVYDGDLFHKRVAYAEAAGKPWAVLSAKWGLWLSDRDIAPARCGGLTEAYSLKLDELAPILRMKWHALVLYDILHNLPEWTGDECNADPRTLDIEIHAGAEYAHPLDDLLTAYGFKVTRPCKGLGIGQQLSLYTSGEYAPEKWSKPEVVKEHIERMEQPEEILPLFQWSATG